MHGAKGLEYPIVALANLGARSAANPRSRCRASSEPPPALPGRRGQRRPPRPLHDPRLRRGVGAGEGARRGRAAAAALRRRDPRPRPPDRPVRGRAASTPSTCSPRSCRLPDDESLVDDRRRRRARAADRSRARGRAATETEIDAAVEERAAWIADARAAQAGTPRASARSRPPRAASARAARSRPRSRTFDAALVVGEGPPIPVGDAVHMVMERISLPGAEDLDAIAEDVCLEGDIAERPPGRDRDVPRLPELAERQRAAGLERLLARGAVRASAAPRAERRRPAPLATGRVDLVYRRRRRLVVVDYKTDQDVTEGDAPRSTPRSTTAARPRSTPRRSRPRPGCPFARSCSSTARAGAEVAVTPQ